MLRPVLCLLIVVTLGGCVSYRPATHSPLVTIPETFDSGPARAPLVVCTQLVSDPAAIALLESHGDNLDLQLAASRIRQAEATARLAGSPLWPRLDAQLEGSRGDTPFRNFNPLATGTASTWQGSVAASYELDLWSRIRNESLAAQLEHAAADATREALAVSIKAQIYDAWLAAVAEQQLLSVLTQQVETSQKFLQLTRLRFGLGQVPATDIGRQEQQLLALQAQQSQARANTALLMLRLEQLLGAAPGQIPVTVHTLPPVTPVADPGVPAETILQRPDIRSAQLRLSAADRRTAAAISERLPRLRLSASLVSLEQDIGDIFREVFWSLGTSLSATLFDKGALEAAAELRRAQADEAFIEYSIALLRAVHEIQAALVRNARDDQLSVSIEAQHRESQRVLELTRDAYRQGQASYLDVLTALNSLQSLQRQRVTSHRQQLSSRIDLCRAAGVAPGPETTT